MAMEIEAARLLVYRSASLVDAQDPRMTYFASLAMCYAGDAAMKVTTDAVQILGGYGYLREYPVERMMRDAKLAQILVVTNELQDPDPREPCGARGYQPPLTEAALALFEPTGTSRMVIEESVWSLSDDLAQRAVDDVRRDIHPGCPEFRSETPFGESQTNQFL